MITNRYRRRLVTLHAYERMFAQDMLDDEDGDASSGYDAELDFISRAEGKIEPWYTRRTVIESSTEQITYNFSDRKRDNMFPAGRYGAPNFSYRMLYEFLCKTYNGGEYFIDSYFSQVFPYRPVYARFKNFSADLNEAVTQELRSDGVSVRDEFGRFISASAPQARVYEGKSWKSLSVWRDERYKSEIRMLGKDIREDAVLALSTGMIPLVKKSVSSATRKIRARLGLDPSHVFYASGRLINHLNVYVAMDTGA